MNTSLMRHPKTNAVLARLKTHSDVTKTMEIPGIDGKVRVTLRNGRLTTGHSSVSKKLPNSLRCLEGWVWVNEISNKEIVSLQGRTVSQVVLHYCQQ